MTVKLTKSRPTKGGTALATSPVVFDQPHLILVEGADDQVLVAKLIDHEKLTGFHVHELGGKDSAWSDSVSFITASPEFRANGKSVGLVQDADTNAAAAFQSLASALTSAALPAPITVEAVTGGPGVRTGVFVFPSANQAGTLEDLALLAAEAQRVALAQQYVQLVASATGSGPKSTSKAALQSYIACYPKVVRTFADGLKESYFILSSAALDPLRTFLRALT